MATKSGAHADTRYCDLLPQRIDVVPATLRAGDTVSLRVGDDDASRLVLAGFPEPPPTGARLRYVRLVWGRAEAPRWATSGQVLYANDHQPDVVPGTFPYILGGHCVRRPTAAALSDYQRAGYLRGLTLTDLRDIYRAEGIEWLDDQRPGLHLLEGGSSLTAPLPVTVGYARLFGQRHAPYRPRSDRVRRLSTRLAAVQVTVLVRTYNRRVATGLPRVPGRPSASISEGFARHTQAQELGT